MKTCSLFKKFTGGDSVKICYLESNNIGVTFERSIIQIFSTRYLELSAEFYLFRQLKRLESSEPSSHLVLQVS